MRFFGLLLAAVLTFYVLAGQSSDIPQISPQQLLAEPAKHVILDVRSEQEFADGHVPGAINIPHGNIEDALSSLDKNASYVVYCRSGRRAAIAENVLVENGFHQLQHLTGDYIGWQQQGLPINK